MISLTPLIVLIRTGQPSGFADHWFREVGGAAEFAKTATIKSLPLPACWLVRDADTVTPKGERAEDVALAFDVVIAITNVRMQSAGETDDALLRYRRAVHALLLGWRYPQEPLGTHNRTWIRSIKFAGGQVIEYTDGDLWWRDRYTFDAHLTNYLPDPPPFDRLQPVTGENL
ncbi:hypothetical protein [Rhodoferax sp. BLA1]|uniref:phage tail terminator protein n=1 Tax=Rhodoferax sp. BLA1 TaxID=2576062 RepID=UPI0015D39674|nr:hypothetical protein [Rhodoferax sp. BLA1]